MATLGFSENSEISETPGNAGFKDQVLAINWIQKSRLQWRFNRMTIAGQSSGVSVPMSTGLFSSNDCNQWCNNLANEIYWMFAEKQAQL